MIKYSGHFFDGQTAKKHSVSVELGLDALNISEEDSAFSVHWPLEDLRAIRAIQPDQPLELTCTATPDARLVIDDPTFAEAVLEHAPHLARRRGFTPRWWERPVTVTLAILAFVGVVIFTVPWLAGPLARTVPDSWRTAMGTSTEELVLSIGSECSTPTGTAAVTKLIAALGDPDGPGPTSVKVINAKMVNAFALPGGRIIVMGELLDLMETPDELAAVLAHEMGHVSERHPTEAAIRATGFSLFLTMLVGESSKMAEFLASLGVQAVQSSYSRDDERAADRIAADLLEAAGADKSAIGTVFGRLQKAQEGKMTLDLGRLGAFLSTHPSYEERIAAAPHKSDAIRRPLLTGAEWRALKNICGKATPKKSPSGGRDELGQQSVDVRRFFQMHHMPGAREHVAAGAVG
ncbi:MAG: M48 family metalloprotease [Rhodospirillales bacterium]|nr:M48 family metalloprotease [Rhodospirillales bacterium]